MLVCVLVTIGLSAYTLIYGSAVRVAPTTLMYVTMTATVMGFLATLVDYTVKNVPLALAPHAKMYNGFNRVFVRLSGLMFAVVLSMNVAYIVRYGAGDPYGPDMHGDARMDRIVQWIGCNIAGLAFGLVSITLMWALYAGAAYLTREDNGNRQRARAREDDAAAAPGSPDNELVPLTQGGG